LIYEISDIIYTLAQKLLFYILYLFNMLPYL